MFVKEEGKESPVIIDQEETAVLETEGGIRIILRTEAADKITASLEIRQEEEAAVFLHAFKQPEEPFFGPQTHLDPAKGVSCRMTLEGTGRLMAVYQHKNWWIRPAFPACFGDIPKRTQLLLAEKKTGAGSGREYLAVLAVCGEEYRTDIAGDGQELRITAASNCMNKSAADDLSLVLAAGSDPYLCCERAVKKALALTGKQKMFRKERTYPEMFDYFGWCSWDAFYHEVSQDGIMKKMDELADKQIPVRWVLIDDGWLDADYKKQVLKGLDAAADKFPGGLGACVSKLKKEYGIRQVGVWHAVMGYWNGLEPGSPAREALQEGSRILEDGRIVPDAEAGKAFRFYDTWHDYLRNICDIDFVKVDGQSAVSLFYAGRKEYGRASGEIQKGLNASAALHFDNQIINCMGMASEDMWNRPSSAVSRSSDDFVPDVPHGFREHAIQNGYNSLLQGQFFWGDWDMFWSDHEENWQNSILRAVSGGPVYTSDKVGRTDGKFIMPLLKKDGRVIRCEEVGMPTLDSLFENPVDTTHVLKLFNRYRDSYVIAAFNINKEDQACEGSVSLADLPGLDGGTRILYSYRERKAVRLEAGKDYSFRLEPNDGELFLLLPDKEFTVLGILEKYIGAGCVETVREGKEKTTVILSEGGTFGFLSGRKPTAVMYDGVKAETEGKETEGSGSSLYQVRDPFGESDKEGRIVEIIW